MNTSDFNCQQLVHQAYSLSQAVQNYLVAAETFDRPRPGEAAAARGAAAMATAHLIDCARCAHNEVRSLSAQQWADEASSLVDAAQRSLRSAEERAAVKLGEKKTAATAAAAGSKLYLTPAALAVAQDRLHRVLQLLESATVDTVDDVDPEFLQLLLRARYAVQCAATMLSKESPQ